MATFRYFDSDFHTRLGVTEAEMREILSRWPTVKNTVDVKSFNLAINNSLNDLLYGIGIGDEEAIALTGANREELSRIFSKWRLACDRNSTSNA